MHKFKITDISSFLIFGFIGISFYMLFRHIYIMAMPYYIFGLQAYAEDISVTKWSSRIIYFSNGQIEDERNHTLFMLVSFIIPWQLMTLFGTLYCFKVIRQFFNIDLLATWKRSKTKRSDSEIR